MKNSFFSPPGWVKVVVWVVAILVTAMGPPGALFVALPVAIIYTNLPWLIFRISEKAKAKDNEEWKHREIERTIEESSTVTFLKTLFEDVKFINETSGADRLQFDHAEITLQSEQVYSDMYLYTTADKKHIEFIEKYNALLHRCLMGEEGLNKEKIFEEFRAYYPNEKNGYIAKNPDFLKTLEDDGLSWFEAVTDNNGNVTCYKYMVLSFKKTYVDENVCNPFFIAEAITKWAVGEGYLAYYTYDRENGRYELTIHF